MVENIMNMLKKEKTKETDEHCIQSEKARKGWIFSVVFLMIIVMIILFLSFIPINEQNRDIIVGMLGTITGAIGSMIAIASGRDPAEVEELKEKLSGANADRQALISRLRDSQIQLQILRDQLFDLQNAMIIKLSMFNKNDIPNKKNPEEVVLNSDVESWLPKEEKD